MDAEIIAIGNEVTDGTIVNSNAAFLAQGLSGEGYRVCYHTAVPDEESLMLDAFARAQGRAQVVAVSGGLGPTVDDLTMAVAAKYFGRPLKRNEAAWEKIQGYFRKAGREIGANQEKQAWLPEGAEVLNNGRGTAPGAYVLHQGVHFGFFPGIPSEMEVMFTDGFLPLLRRALVPATRRYLKVLRCFGLPEGQMDQQLREQVLAQLNPLGLYLGFRVRFPTIDLRLETASADPEEARERLEAGADLLRNTLGEHIFGTGEDRLAEVVGAMLRERAQSLAVAESCTGGMLADQITHVPGASDYFLGGVVAYANEAKTKLLGVQEATLQGKGAVSAEAVLEMAAGARKRFGSHWALATSGIAGPTGGTKEKPVGTVQVALVGPTTQWERQYLFPFSRMLFKKVVVATALDRLRRVLLRDGP